MDPISIIEMTEFKCCFFKKRPTNHPMYKTYKSRYIIFKGKLSQIPEESEIHEFNDYGEMYLKRYKYSVKPRLKRTV